MEILGLVWFVSWIATIIVASQRGGFNQGCLGFFTGFLFGPLALIIALTYKPYKCDYCKESVDKRAIVCPHCQKNIVPKG